MGDLVWCHLGVSQHLEAGEHQGPLREPSLPGHCTFIFTEEEQGFAGLEFCEIKVVFWCHFGKEMLLW